MTAEQKARLFGQVFGLLDSDQAGERAAAADKLYSLRPKMGWPTCVDVLRRLESTVAPEQFEQVERDRDQWVRAHDEKVTENAKLTQHNAALITRIAGLRTALWFMVNWRKVMGATVAVALSCGGGWCWWNADAAPDQGTVAGAPTVDSAFDNVLSRMRWGEGETDPRIVTVDSTAYWVLVRGSTDSASHVDASDRQVPRHCLQLYASKAIPDQGAFMRPSPYMAFGLWMTWPQRAAECRMPGTRNYQ